MQNVTVEHKLVSGSSLLKDVQQSLLDFIFFEAFYHQDIYYYENIKINLLIADYDARMYPLDVSKILRKYVNFLLHKNIERFQL